MGAEEWICFSEGMLLHISRGRTTTRPSIPHNAAYVKLTTAQQPFVEFFIPSTSWQTLQPRLDRTDGVTYFAGNAAGDFEASDEDSVNPVTWGSFAGKEIITPTIIEKESFRAWLEEAFGTWREWQRVYPPQSATARMLRGVREDVWLVNVIHHRYVERNALWELLLGE